MSVPSTRKDPVIALVLGIVLPGAGFAYAGSFLRFVRALAVIGLLYWLGAETPFLRVLAICLHLFQAIASAGAVRRWNEIHAAPPPPPPPPHTWRAAAPAEPSWAHGAAPPPPEPAPPPPLPVTGPVLGPDAFLVEVRDAWDDMNRGEIGPEAFAERKRSAIERVRVVDVDDGVALLEATSALVGAGVLTPAERSRLKLRVSRP